MWRPAPRHSAIGRRSLAGQQLLQSNPLGGFSRLFTVCISMYWFCAYFSDLDGALYFFKLSFVSVTLATFRSPVKVGAILLPVSCFISQSELANESHAFISHPFWPWANQRACFWWEQPSWMLTRVDFHHFILGLCREQRW